MENVDARIKRQMPHPEHAVIVFVIMVLSDSILTWMLAKYTDVTREPSNEFCGSASNPYS